MRDLTLVSKLSIPKLIDYVVEEFHSPLREDLEKMDIYIEKVANREECREKMILPKELFKQFKSEILLHIDNEENDFFPEIINLEQGGLEDFMKVKRFLRMQELEHNEIDNYLIGGKKIIDELTIKDFDDYVKLKEILEKIYKDTLDHVYIENNYLNGMVEDLIRK